MHFLYKLFNNRSI